MRVSIDEGGARCFDGAARRYVPFSSIADVDLESHVLRSPSVVALLASGERRTLFAGGDSLEIHRGLVEHLASLRRHVATPAPPEWARAGRGLDEWLSSVTSAGAASSYRDEGDPIKRALAILDDADGDIESRAAAAHVLARSDDARVLVTTAKIIEGRALPPLVVVAARLGAPSMYFDGFAEATSFLDAPDRELALLRTQSTTPSALHEQALARAKRELADESLLAPPPEQHGSTRARREAAGVSRDAGRWVGKTWGF